MANLAGFDASQVPEQQDFAALPEGQYVAIATSSEEKVTKAGTGKYLQITFEVMDGPAKGRKLWARLNLWNPNQTAKEIAQRELGALCRAVGVIRPNDSSELHNKPLVLTVKVELDDKQRQSNTISKYEPLPQAGMPAAPPAAPQAQAPAFQSASAAPAAAAAPASMPWAR